MPRAVSADSTEDDDVNVEIYGISQSHGAHASDAAANDASATNADDLLPNEEDDEELKDPPSVLQVSYTLV